jgi:hypothetical protein
MKIIRVSTVKLCFKKVIKADLIKSNYNKTNIIKKANKKPQIYKYGI